MSVRRCQLEVDSQEFTEWQAFGDLEPSGERRADLRAAMICAAVFSAPPGATGHKPDDFMPALAAIRWYENGFDEQIAVEWTIAEKIRAWAIAAGAKAP